MIAVLDFIQVTLSHRYHPLVLIMQKLLHIFFFLQAEDGIRDWRDWSSDVCSSDLMGMRKPNFYRLLNPPEQELLRRVFGNTLPQWREIGIGNGLGWGGAPWSSTINNAGYPQTPNVRSEERRVGKSVDLGGRRIIKK